MKVKFEVDAWCWSLNFDEIQYDSMLASNVCLKVMYSILALSTPLLYILEKYAPVYCVIYNWSLKLIVATIKSWAYLIDNKTHLPTLRKSQIIDYSSKIYLYNCGESILEYSKIISTNKIERESSILLSMIDSLIPS